MRISCILIIIGLFIVGCAQPKIIKKGLQAEAREFIDERIEEKRPQIEDKEIFQAWARGLNDFLIDHGFKGISGLLTFYVLYLRKKNGNGIKKMLEKASDLASDLSKENTLEKKEKKDINECIIGKAKEQNEIHKT
jgi:hypothetical protein